MERCCLRVFHRGGKVTACEVNRATAAKDDAFVAVKPGLENRRQNAGRTWHGSGCVSLFGGATHLEHATNSSSAEQHIEPVRVPQWVLDQSPSFSLSRSAGIGGPEGSTRRFAG